MQSLEVISLSIPMAMALGLAFGAGPCSITCLPYLGPVFVANDVNNRQAWRTVLPFSLGRLTGYSLLGLSAGALGQSLKTWLATPVVGWLLGGASILVGLSLLRRRGRNRCGSTSCASTTNKSGTVSVSLPTHSQPSALPGGLFLMGAGMALNPCAPLGTVLLAASFTGSALMGLGLGLGFGAGAVIIPSLIFAFGVAHFGRQLREHMPRWRPGLEIAASTMLILLGLSTALGWVKP